MEITHYVILAVLLVFGFTEGIQIKLCEIDPPKTIQCTGGQVLQVYNVIFGRTLPPTECNPYQVPIANFNCRGSPASYQAVSAMCDGKMACTLQADVNQLGGDPCAQTPKHLLVDYQCITPTQPTTPTTPTTTITTTTTVPTMTTTTTTPSTTPTSTPTTTPTTQTTITSTQPTTQTTPTTVMTTITTTQPSPTSSQHKVICEQQGETIRCIPGYELDIDTVFYGRIQTNLCNPFNVTITNTHCASTNISTNSVKSICNHQSSCLLTADNHFLREDPCPNVPKYLQVTYHCNLMTTPHTTTASTPTSTSPTSTSSTTSTAQTTSGTTVTPTTSTTPTTTSTTPATTPTTSMTTTPTTTTTTPTTSSTTTTPTPTSTTTTPTPTSTTTIPTSTSTTTTPTPTSTTTTPTPTSTTTTPTSTSTTTTTTTTPTTTTMTTTPTSTTSPTTITTTPTTTSTTTSTTMSTPTSTRSTPTSTQTPTSTITTATTTTTVLTVGPWIAPVNVPAGAQVCHEYLVSGPNGIPDSSLTASSQWNSHLPFDHNGPERARLFSLANDFGNGTYYRGAWSAGVNDKNQYVQAEFRSPCLIRGIVTQGRHVNPNTLCCHQRVTLYNVLYSNDGNNWETIKDDQGKDKTFKGNLDQDSLVTHMLACPIIAKFIRINPVDWVTHIALRFDVIGCPTNTDNLGVCPKGWLERPGSSTCYFFHTGSDVKSWDDAERYCLLEQGHLVEIDSVQERDWVRQEAARIGGLAHIDMWWVGLSNQPRTDDKDYKWIDGKSLDIAITPWLKGQPDNINGNEHCGQLWKNDLSDYPCPIKIHYICEKRKYWTVPSMASSSASTNTPITSSTTTTSTSTSTSAMTTTPMTSQTTTASSPSTSTSTTTTATPMTSQTTTTSFQTPATVTTKAPTQGPYFVPTQKGGGNAVQTSTNLFATGCMKSVKECSLKGQGDFQSCTGCQFYATCAPSGFFVRPCPMGLKWDDILKTCQYTSSTCQGP